jgi:(2Fe-2S) ferredoxin
MERLKTIGELAELRESLSKDFFNKDKKVLKVCCGLPCSTLGSHEVANILTAEISNLGQDVKVVRTGCQGLCQRGPLVKVEPYGYMYQRVKQDKAKKIPYITFSLGEPVRDLLYRDSYFEKPVENWKEVPFYSKQLKIALRNTGEIDPLNIYDYISFGGYKALEKVLSSMSPEEVIEEVRKSNLRGRGGAGFPTGVKWAHTRRAPGSIKMVIANGDEGDPGAFMDRSIMEGDPHSLLEGMLICAYAIGAQYGIIYVRHEYPLAIQTLRKAIKQANEVGLLGENILSTGFDFQIYIKEGAGAFVCGEATALVASVEGKRGFPHPRPPRVSEPGGGPWGYPANLNNIETYACVPPIIERGADWFLSIGTPVHLGQRYFLLLGR